jgi:hypothetical protein
VKAIARTARAGRSKLGDCRTAIGDVGESRRLPLRAGCLQPSGSELATEPPAGHATRLRVTPRRPVALLVADGGAGVAGGEPAHVHGRFMVPRPGPWPSRASWASTSMSGSPGSAQPVGLVIGFGPPAVEPAQVQPALDDDLHAAGAAGLKRRAWQVQPPRESIVDCRGREEQRLTSARLELAGKRLGRLLTVGDDPERRRHRRGADAGRALQRSQRAPPVTSSS